MKNSRINAKDIIINVASGIFSRFGLFKTSIDQIARESHKSKSSIYYHFKNKDEIFKFVVEKEMEQLKYEIKKSVNNQDTIKGKFKSYIITRVKYLGELENIYAALTEDYLTHYDFIKHIRKIYYRNELEIIRNILETGIKKGVFIVTDIDSTAVAIVIALKGFEHPLALRNYTTKLETTIDIFLDILFSGLNKKLKKNIS
ncbi:MAG: TetR family transcriptional regulator [Proteobacteria bacterium]|nr:TetR family transcriptional regulator [Pseudomonadota bacterium]